MFPLTQLAGRDRMTRTMDSRPGFILGTCAFLAAFMLLASTRAHATPAFARQTGIPCEVCHAVAYGPVLTPFGMNFKLNGFTMTDGNGHKIPMAGQVIWTHSVPARGKDTSEVSEADLYLAGRISDHVGGFAKIENDNQGHGKFKSKLSELDVRFVAQDLKLFGKSATVGVSINDSPGFEDPIAALPDASFLGPPGVTGTLLNPSSPNAPAGRVIGATVYGLYKSVWYGEIGTYSSLSPSQQDDLGFAISGDPGKLSDTGYLRFAYMKDFGAQFFSAGTVLLTTRRQFPRTAPADDLTDLGYDLTYQFLGDHKNIVQLAYVNILERRHYGSTPESPITPGLFALPRGAVHDQILSATYVFHQSYGITLAHLVSTGTHDAVRFVPYGSPDTTSNLLSVYWTPWGKTNSLTTIANLKLTATWFHFSRFNGSATNIFGAPTGAPVTNARDLNAFSISASAAF